jgi:lysine 2,3-aminomutase
MTLPLLPPKVPKNKWENWHWQMSNRMRLDSNLSDYFKNIPSSFFDSLATNRLNLLITPYMLSKMDSKMNVTEIQKNPWFLQFFPIGPIYDKGYDAFDGHENWDLTGEFPTKILQHKYPNRVLLYAPICLAYCNFCFKANEQLDLTKKSDKIWSESEWKNTLAYIQKTPGIEELVFSGGDPFVLSDEQIDKVFSDLSKIKNKDGSEKVFLKRIHTRALTHIPYRITPKLVHVLKKHKINQLIFNVAHPSEITPEFVNALSIIRKGIGSQGIMLAMHTPLLQDINDNSDILWNLFSTAGKLNIKPYYLVATFPNTPYANRQRVPVSTMMNLMDKLRREKSPAYLPTPIVPHPQRKIILPYYTVKSIECNGNPYLEATEIYNDNPQTYKYPDVRKRK